MKRALGLALGLCLVGSAAATELDLSVESGGSNSITVAPGEVVNYEVIGSLSDDVNEGLALAGFDLECTCGPLSPADEPTTEPITVVHSPATFSFRSVAVRTRSRTLSPTRRFRLVR